MKKIWAFTALFAILFFGEIALSFSDKGYPSLLQADEVPFSLNLDNSYSEWEGTEVIDESVSIFLQTWDIEGASLAITKDERLVYAKGFGISNSETGEEVKPGHLFRIASVSKLITAAGIMKLVEEGKLGLDDHVFGPSGILNDRQYQDYKDKRINQITVRHLLNHTAGWSRLSGDPLLSSLYVARKMDVEAPAGFSDVLKFTLSRRLNYAPGSRYSYSNMGYAILGEVIARKSGMPYQDYIVMNLLKPIGIHDMHIGRSYYQEKFPNEVRYHSTGGEALVGDMHGDGSLVPAYYGGNNMELLGPAGGWVASAPELIKFLTALDGFPSQPDILTTESILMMSDPDQAGQGLFGWRGSDPYGTWWRTGYLTGSSALMVRQHDGLNWVILLNTSTSKQSRIHRYVSGMMFQSVNRVKEWPSLDLFGPEFQTHNAIEDIPATNPNL
ncbi:MAG: serine hydrolase domain-containing protein [Bacteroidales bacterium]